MNSKHHVKIKKKSHKKRLLLVVRNSELLSIFDIFGSSFGKNVQKLEDFFWNYLNFFINDDLKKGEIIKDLYILNNSNKENGY